MIKSRKHPLFTFFACILFLGLQAQETPEIQSINEGSIENQFEFAIKKSTNWKDERGQAYKVIKRNLFQSLQSHTIDTLNAIKANYVQVVQQVDSKQNEINTLKTDLTNIEQTLETTNQEKESMTFLGKSMSKSGYNLLVWSIISVLGGLLLFFIYKFQNSNVVTKSARKDLTKVEREFEQYRKRVLGREQTLKRQLQDELNKQLA